MLGSIPDSETLRRSLADLLLPSYSDVALRELACRLLDGRLQGQDHARSLQLQEAADHSLQVFLKAYLGCA